MNDLHSSQLLLQCLKIEDLKIKATNLSQFSHNDWEAILVEANKHGLAPLLAGKLSVLPAHAKPPENVRQSLQNALRFSASRNLLLYHGLCQVLEALNEASIHAIVLKGAFLAEGVYENIGMRPMVDVDLMVPRDQLENVANILHRFGFSSQYFRLGDELSNTQELSPFHKPNAPILDIHWSIVSPSSPFKIDIDGIWKRTNEAKFSDVKALALSPEDMLLHHCLHLAYQHAFSTGLRPFLDITETLCHFREELDWLKVQNRAIEWNAAKSLFICLELAKELLNAPVRGSVLQAFRPADLDQAYLPAVRNYVLSGPRSLSPNISELVEDVSWSQKFVRLIRRIFPPKKVMVREYNLSENSWRVYYFYIVRMRSIFMRNRGSAWRLMRQEPEVMAIAKQQNTIYMIKEWMGSE